MMKDWMKWALVLVVCAAFGYWLYRQGERRERFRMLVAARTWLRAEKMGLETWARDEQQRRAEQAQLQNHECHIYTLGSDHIHSSFTNPASPADGLTHGTLDLNVELRYGKSGFTFTPIRRRAGVNL